MFNEFEFTICVYFLNKMGFYLEDIKDLIGMAQTSELCVKLFFLMSFYASKDYCNSMENMMIYRAFVNQSDISPWFNQQFRTWTRKKQHYLKIVPSGSSFFNLDLNQIYKRFQNQLFEMINEDTDYNAMVANLVAPHMERKTSFLTRSKRSGRNEDEFSLHSLYKTISNGNDELNIPKIETCGNIVVPPMQKVAPTIQGNDLCTICKRNSSLIKSDCFHNHLAQEQNENPQAPLQQNTQEDELPNMKLEISKVPSFWNENQELAPNTDFQYNPLSLNNQSSFQFIRYNSTMNESNNPF